MKLFLKLTNPPRVTAQTQKVCMVNGKPRFYKPKKLQDAKKVLIWSLMPYRPIKPLEGPIKLEVSWRFKRGRHKHNEWKITKPDTDNLEKMLKDCMTEVGFWNDDAQVVVEHVEKVWTDEPTGIEIEIITLPKIKEVANNGS